MDAAQLQRQLSRSNSQVNTLNTQAGELETHIEGEKEDPFLILGFGLYTYRITLRVLTLFFLIVTIIVSPILYIYSQGGGINQD